MVSTKIINIFNVTLGLTALVLILSLLGVTVPNVGQAYYHLDRSEPICIVKFQDQQAPLNVDECCLKLQQQLECDTNNNPKLRTHLKCTVTEVTPDYLINWKTYRYCQKNKFI